MPPTDPAGRGPLSLLVGIFVEAAFGVDTAAMLSAAATYEPKAAETCNAAARQPEVWCPSDDWTTAVPTQALFVVLTVIAVPWFVARLRSRFSRLPNSMKAAAGRDVRAAHQHARQMKDHADLHGLFMRRCRYLTRAAAHHARCGGRHDPGSNICDGEIAMTDLVDIAIPANAQAAAEALGLKVQHSITNGAWVRRLTRDEAEIAIECLRDSGFSVRVRDSADQGSRPA